MVSLTCFPDTWRSWFLEETNFSVFVNCKLFHVSPQKSNLLCHRHVLWKTDKAYFEQKTVFSLLLINNSLLINENNKTCFLLTDDETPSRIIHSGNCKYENGESPFSEIAD